MPSGLFAHLGPLQMRTGQYTGRSPRDKYVVQEASSQDQLWWGEINQPLEPDRLAGPLSGGREGGWPVR